MRRQPHGAAEDLGWVFGVAGYVEETMLDTPLAAEPEGNSVAGQRDLR
jgi:hypothetical protein